MPSSTSGASSSGSRHRRTRHRVRGRGLGGVTAAQRQKDRQQAALTAGQNPWDDRAAGGDDMLLQHIAAGGDAAGAVAASLPGHIDLESTLHLFAPYISPTKSASVSSSMAAAGVSRSSSPHAAPPASAAAEKDPFDPEAYLLSYYARHDPATAGLAHLQELQVRRSIAAATLKSFVGRHYHKFIDTSTGIIQIEADMLQLTDMVNDYKVGMKALQSVSFCYDDDAVSLKEKAARLPGSATGSSFLGVDEDGGDGDNGTTTKQPGSKHKDKGFMNLGELEDFAEELRSRMYERKFEQAVVLVEKAATEFLDAAVLADDEHDGAADEPLRKQQGRKAANVRLLLSSGHTRKFYDVSKHDSPDVAYVKRDIERRVAKLVNFLTYELRSESLKKFEQRQIISNLVRLQHADRALYIFLLSRSLNSQSLIRSRIKFRGDITLYVAELSSIVFGEVSDAFSEFRSLFGGNREMMSTVIMWAVHELAEFAKLFHKQVFQSEDMFAKLGKCLRCAYEGVAGLEKEGLPLSFYLSKMLTPLIVEVIRKNYKHVEMLLSDAIVQEKWVVTELWVHDSSSRRAVSSSSKSQRRRALRLTSSAKFLYDIVRNLLREAVPILANPVYPPAADALYPVVVSGLVRLFEWYFSALSRLDLRLGQGGLQSEQESKVLSAWQSFSIIADTFYISDDLIPRILREFRKHFQRGMPGLELYRTRLVELYTQLIDSFGRHNAQFCLKRVLKWPETSVDGAVRYCQTSISKRRAVPSDEIEDLAGYLADLYRKAKAALPVNGAARAVSQTLHYIVKVLMEGQGSGASTRWGVFSFGYGGLHQCVLDWKYLLLEQCGPQVTFDVGEACDSIVSLAVHRYCAAHSVESDHSILKDDSFFVEIIARHMAGRDPKESLRSMVAVDGIVRMENRDDVGKDGDVVGGSGPPAPGHSIAPPLTLMPAATSVARVTTLGAGGLSTRAVAPLSNEADAAARSAPEQIIAPPCTLMPTAMSAAPTATSGADGLSTRTVAPLSSDADAADHSAPEQSLAPPPTLMPTTTSVAPASGSTESATVQLSEADAVSQAAMKAIEAWNKTKKVGGGSKKKKKKKAERGSKKKKKKKKKEKLGSDGDDVDAPSARVREEKVSAGIEGDSRFDAADVASKHFILPSPEGGAAFVLPAPPSVKKGKIH